MIIYILVLHLYVKNAATEELKDTHLSWFDLRSIMKGFFTFPEEDAAEIAMRFLWVFHHGAERAFSSDAADLLIGQWKVEELWDRLHTFGQVLHGKQKGLKQLFAPQQVKKSTSFEFIYFLIHR